MFVSLVVCWLVFVVFGSVFVVSFVDLLHLGLFLFAFFGRRFVWVVTFG